MERKLRETLQGGRFADVPASHSRRMSAIKGGGNRTTEARFMGILIRAGVRGWKVHPKGLFGNPDLFFPVERVAVFLDGCFWHGCPRCGHLPGVNRPYWQAKIARNQERDRVNVSRLRSEGIRTLRLWEHELLDGARCLSRLRALLTRRPG
jgi:DNA mismatch endonuclease (patch repair protein)